MKKIVMAAEILIDGEDVSHRTVSWSVSAGVNEPYWLYLVLLDDGTVEIEEPPRGKLRVAQNGQNPERRRITLRGKDISSLVRSYAWESEVGEIDRLRLQLYCDSDRMSVNGTRPWEELS